jgi:hypothetical protein
VRCQLVAALVVVLGMQLARLVAVVLSVEVVGPGDMRMVRRLLVVSGCVRLGGEMVVPCGVLMVLRRVPVVIDLFLMGRVICG